MRYRRANNQTNQRVTGVGVYTITADSTPDYDGWGPDKYWGARHWQQWFYAMKQKYGYQYAKDKWAAAVERVDPLEAFNTYRYKRDFWDFMKKEGLLKIGSNSVADAVMRSGSAVDTTIDSAAGTIGFITKMVPFVLVGVGVYLLAGNKLPKTVLR